MLANPLVSSDDNTPMFDVDANLISSVGDLAILRQQEIPDWYVKQLSDERFDSANRPAGEFMKVASIPVFIHERWLREGFDCTREPIKAVVRRLKLEGLDKLLTTTKRL